MYNTFFDFKEKPFKLVPNPEFLFLGRTHEEALAHLTYAVSQGDGFVEITGEVGTGKTTLCRVFLENLSQDVEAAFIFNPKLDSVQLLKTIHNELSIPAGNEDPVSLTDSLNRFLLEKKAQGKSVLLLIDEAQNLNKDTLEQIRLISNLETTRSKLIQIVLVGQPELCDMLDSHEMRQLRQRINLSCHILPLTPKETHAYIIHRLTVAQSSPASVFTSKAMDLVYDFSRGIPRLINIACDRALLVAYGLGQKKITPGIVQSALKELEHRKTDPNRYGSRLWKPLGFLLLMLFSVAVLWTMNKGLPTAWVAPKPSADPAEVKKAIPERPETMSLSKTDTSETPPAASEPRPPDSAEAPHIKKTGVRELTAAIDSASSRNNALAHVLSVWKNLPQIVLDTHLKSIEPDHDFFSIASGQHHLDILRIKADMNLIKKLNLPAIIGLKTPDRPGRTYIALISITTGNEYIVFKPDSPEKVKISGDELAPFISGDAFLVWKNIFGNIGTISSTSPAAAVLSVKLLLRQIGFDTIDSSPVYDDAVRDAIKHIQAQYGLSEDGLIGSLTKILLLHEKEGPAIPCLMETDKSSPLKAN